MQIPPGGPARRRLNSFVSADGHTGAAVVAIRRVDANLAQGLKGFRQRPETPILDAVVVHNENVHIAGPRSSPTLPSAQ